MRWLSAWLRYWLERAVLRGSLSLVLLLVGVQACLACAGGLAAYVLPGEHFSSYGAALWWAILRLSDPGYLSDDDPDLYIRALSAALSVLGMSVTVGGIVAIVTQGMNVALQHLAAATTPVPFRDHIVIIGFGDRTPRLLQELLEDTDARIVLLLERVGTEELRRVQRSVSTSQLERIVLRAGSPYRPSELSRAACQTARAVILPASARAVAGDGVEGPLTLKCLLALRRLFEQDEGASEVPTVVVELVDRRLIALIESALPDARILASDRIVARVMRLALQERSLVQLALDVARPDRGLRIHSQSFPDLVGLDILSLGDSIHGAHVMGVLRPTDHGPELVVSHRVTYQSEDRVLLFSRGDVSVHKKAIRSRSVHHDVEFTSSESIRILVLGWNEVAPDLIGELSLEPEGRYRVDFLAPLDPDDMRREVGGLVGETCPVEVRYFCGDPLEAGQKDELSVSQYDRFVVLADRTVAPDLSDVRSLAVAVELERWKASRRARAYVLVELLERENSEVLADVECVVTPLLAADVLSTMALSERAVEVVSHTISHQQAYVTRVVYAARNETQDERQLRRALLEKGLSFLQRLDTDPRDAQCPLLVVEPTRARNNASPESADSPQVPA